jgi:hypothetical protein
LEGVMRHDIVRRNSRHGDAAASLSGHYFHKRQSRITLLQIIHK